MLQRRVLSHPPRFCIKVKQADNLEIARLSVISHWMFLKIYFSYSSSAYFIYIS